MYDYDLFGQGPVGLLRPIYFPCIHRDVRRALEEQGWRFYVKNIHFSYHRGTETEFMRAVYERVSRVSS